MRKSARVAIMIGGGLTAFLIFSPWLIGLYIQKLNYQLLDFYNSSAVKVSIEHYNRGWFQSEATLVIEPLSPQWLRGLEKMGVTRQDAPRAFKIDQRIQHGPFFYHARPHTGFGLAVIDNKIRATSQIKYLFKRLGTNDHFVQLNEDIISFSGKYVKHIVISPYQTTLLPTALTLQWQALEGHLWIEGRTRLRGKIYLRGLAIFDKEDSIQVPEVIVNVDQHKSPHFSWLGKDELNLPQLFWRETHSKSLTVAGIKFKGDFNEISNQLSGTRQLSIDNIQFDNQKIGSFYLKISANKLNAPAVADLVTAYQDTMQRGQLYQSQLQQKIYLMLPPLINTGSSLRIDNLKMVTPSGRLLFNAKLTWPMAKNIMPDETLSLLQNANIQLQLRVSKELIEQFISIVTELSLFQEKGLSGPYKAAREQMLLAGRQNAIILAQMEQEKLIPIENVHYLLALQKQCVPLAEYNAVLKKLLMQKNISLETSYQLSWQYSNVIRPIKEFKKIAKLNQNLIEQQLHMQIKNCIQARYLLLEQGDYVLSILRRQGQLEINSVPALHKKPPQPQSD